jgi:hypothetical protein
MSKDMKKPPMKASKPAMPMAAMPMKRGGSVKGKSPMSDYSSKNPMAFSAK